MKNKILAAFVSEFCETNDVSASDSDKFEIFSIHCVEQGLIRSGHSADKIHLAGDEFGIDGIAFDVNGDLIDTIEDLGDDLPSNSDISLHFYQSKTSPKFDYGDMAKFFDGVRNFFDETKPIEETLSAKRDAFFSSLEQAARFRANPVLKLFYITTGNYEKQAQHEALKSSTITYLKSLNLFSKISIDLLGAGKLQDLYRSAGAPEKRKFTFEKRVALPDIENITESHVGYLPASEFLKLAVEEDSGELDRSIFYDQIRDAYEHSDVNDAIASTISGEKAKLFVLKNNGITVVAKDRDLNGNNFFLTDYQIVNGCQTTTVMFNNIEHIENVMVPLKLVICDDDDIRNEIIIGTNSQNSVKPEHFWALLPAMKDLEVYARSRSEELRLFIERRQNQYRGRDIEKARILKNNELFKAIVSVLEFETKAGRAYKQVVRDYGERLFKNSDEVESYYAAAYLFYRLEYLWRNNRISSNSKIFRFFILSGAGNVLFEGNKILSLSQRQRQRYLERAIEVISDDDIFSAFITKIIEAISSVYDPNHTEPKALRDSLRSELATVKVMKAIKDTSFSLPEL